MNKLMHKIALRCFALLALPLVVAQPARAVVNPEEAMQSAPDWLARIYYGSAVVYNRSQFCMGALVGSRWVVSSLGCFNDSFRILSFYDPDAPSRYLMRFGEDDTYVDVVQRYISADQGMVLYELKEDLNLKPLRVSTLKANELFGTDVTIYGTQSTAPLHDPFYNPGTGRSGKCTIGGVDFASNGTRCYIYTSPVSHSVLVKTQGRIVDPLGPERPVGGVNELVKPVTTGARLYLKFTGEGYTCMEDMGLPITRVAADGEPEMVGMVNASGSVAGVPICGPTLANWFSTASYYLDFFARTQAEASLRALCPGAPVPVVERSGAVDVTMHWNPVPQASGYRVLYTPLAGLEAPSTVEMGAETSLSARLDPAKRYEVAVQAYNESCTSPLSETVYLKAVEQK